MARLNVLLIFIIISFAFQIHCFDVKFKENYNAIVHDFDTHIFKRELTQFFDKASYSFDGLSKVESVPILFPLDICIINLEGIKYATALHKHKDGTRHFAIFRHTHTQTPTYQQLLDLPAPQAIALDCTTHAGRGYVALAYNQTETIERAREGSPIYVISTAEGVRAVQYFAATNLRAMYLRVSGNELTLLQTFESSHALPNLNCPFFKWSGTSFNRVGRIPCSNARRLEPFTIDYEHYVAVANYADEHGRTDVNSEIYKYNVTLARFMLFQRIRTNGAVDVKYFSVPQDEVRRNHFLIFGNSVATKPNGVPMPNMEVDSVFYVYDKGQFVPYQSLPFYAVERFLPVQHEDHEKFLLLVASNKQDIKIFNLNDWKFEESKVQFTEGALSRGVARMRTYVENDQTFLVIANELMADNETNIFLPIYKRDEHANVLRQQIIEWASREQARLASIDIAKLQEAVEEKLSRLTPQQQQQAATPTLLDNGHIKRVQTKSFVSPHLNLYANYWQALSYAKRALDVLEREVASQESGQRTPRSLKSQDAALDEHEHEIVEINVETLLVRDKLQARRINGVDRLEPKYERIKAKKVYVERDFKAPASAQNAPSSADVLNVEHLEIEGQLNGQTWQALVNDTLKRRGLQFIKSPASISNLEAEAVVVTSELVNGESLAQMIPITGGDYIVQQDVQFASPIKAKELLINERLNHIHVHKQRFDVLLKRANWTQVIEGAKRFEQLKVLSPITVAGQLQGERLRAMSPMQAVHQDLHLFGDYTINGDVVIEKQLSAMDVNEVHNRNRSLINTLANGIKVTEQLENVNLNFVAAIRANNTQLSFVNAQDMQDLIKLNHADVQIVEGNKAFRRSLRVRHGFSEVKLLNGHDVEQLPSKLLLKHSNQTIGVPMHIGKVVARGVQAERIKLNSYNLTDYLTQTGDNDGDVQRVRGTLHARQLNVAALNVSNLNTNGDLFGHNLSDIYQHKSLNAPNAALLFREGQKFHGSIYVQNLWLNGTLNNASVGELERALRQLDGNIKFVGDFKFKDEMRFEGVSFDHSLNGIPATEFGRNWLQREGEQDFTAPQTFSNVVCQQDLKLLGKLNGQTLEALQSNTYRIDRDEQMQAVRFENPIEVSGTLHSTQINGLQMPADVLQHTSVSAQLQPQTLYAPLVVHGNLHVQAGIRNASTVNAYNLWALGHYLYGDDADTFYVENAVFNETPSYNTLNRYDLQQMLDHVWLANENVELTMMPTVLDEQQQQQQQRLEMSTANFNGLLEFEGPINNVDMAYLKNNYFSLTREQQIATAVRFVRDVTFTQRSSQRQQQQQPLQARLEAEEIQLEGGALVESGSSTTFNFNEFVANTLKTGGAHYITGEWHMPAATVSGPLENVRINNLNVAQDVLLKNNGNHAPTIIYGEKRVKNAAIKKLYATPRSFVAGVPVQRWINDAVYIYGNHTIYGTTTLESLNLYNDLNVLGLVNGQRVDAEHLLLRDQPQTIRGDLVVQNSLPAAKRILTHNIEHLSAKRINGRNVHEFLEHQAHNHPNLHIESHLIFEQPLAVSNYQTGTGEHTEDGFKWKRDILVEPLVGQNMNEMAKQFPQSIPAKLSHFELRQLLPLDVDIMLPLSLQLDGAQLDVIAVRQGELTPNSTLEFYIWSEAENKFVRNSTFNWLPQEVNLLKILQLVLQRNDFTMLNKEKANLKTIVSSGTPGMSAAIERLRQQKAQLTQMQLGDQDCFGVYAAQSAELMIYCINASAAFDLRVHQAAHIKRSGIKQVLAVERDLIALLNEDADDDNAVATLELWYNSGALNLKLLQSIRVPRAKQMTVAERNGRYYLAVACAQQRQSLAKGTVEIYSTSKLQANEFELLQSLVVEAPLQVAFVDLNAAEELLMYVLTETTQPLLVYQYQGVMGFRQIVHATMLPKARAMTTLTLAAAGRHFVALMAEEPQEVYIVEAVLAAL